jgi:hypothetical protein
MATTPARSGTRQPQIVICSGGTMSVSQKPNAAENTTATC